MLEGSKAFAKILCKNMELRRLNINLLLIRKKAIKYLDEMSYPVVIKASGLAAGKGVVIAQNRKEAEEALNDMMTNKVFAAAGDTVVN